MEDKRKIGERIREIRESKGFTQEALAERVNVSKTTISRLENGSQMVSVMGLIQLARALDVGIESVMWDFVKTYPGDGNEEDRKIHFLLEQCSFEERNYIYENIALVLKYLHKM